MTTNQSYDGPAAEPAQRYFHIFQQAVVANVELATRWTELVAAFSGATGARAATAGELVQDSTEKIVDHADITAVDETTGSAVTDPAEEHERALEAERAEAKHAHELAREPYLSLTKAELSALLAERGLPRTGTINTLIERLVAADAQ